MGHGVASSASSLAVTSLLALSGKISSEEAIGYGLLTRGAFLSEMLLSNKYKELGVPTAPRPRTPSSSEYRNVKSEKKQFWSRDTSTIPATNYLVVTTFQSNVINLRYINSHFPKERRLISTVFMLCELLRILASFVFVLDDK